MIRAEIKQILCSDEPNGDFSAYRPEDHVNFSCALQLLIGQHDKDGSESFQLTLCTPQWLVDNHAEEDVVVGRNLLIVFDFNYQRIVRWLNRYIERCTGETWAEVAKRISYIGLSEFEDYHLSDVREGR
ncbi:MAG: immunity 8 family protein [Anaerolineae bacterium]|nr:immunity 8 family protein [Anaerolineae bacterium]